MQKNVLVTGSSSGIGLASCLYLKQRGWTVFATARKEKDVAHLKSLGLMALPLDVTDSEQIKDTLTKVLEHTGGTLYGLCNNAGYAQPGALEDISKESMKAQFETNVFGLQDLTNQVLPIMRRQGYGRIIHISSILGIISLPFRGAYNASKYAVEGLGDTLRLELRNSGIYLSMIEPGPILSNFRRNALHAYETEITVEKSFFQQEYHNFAEKFKANKAALLGAKPEKVAKKILHALESRHPRSRYYVTAPAYTFAFLKRCLPQRMLDLILAKIAKQEIN